MGGHGSAHAAAGRLPAIYALTMDAWTRPAFGEAASAIALQWFLVTMSVVIGRVAHLVYTHGFRLAMVWFVKLITDPLTDLVAYTPLHVRRV